MNKGAVQIGEHTSALAALLGDAEIWALGLVLLPVEGAPAGWYEVRPLRGRERR